MTITAKERADAIAADFQAFLNKWQLEMNVETSTFGYNGTSVDGVEFSWDAIYDENHNTVLEYGFINVGNWGRKEKSDA